MKFCEGFAFKPLQEALLKGEPDLDVYCVSLGLKTGGKYEPLAGRTVVGNVLVEGREKRIAVFSIWTPEQLRMLFGKELGYFFTRTEVVFIEVVGLKPDAEGRFLGFREKIRQGGGIY
ncbi:MAG: hypothetical protein HGA33_02975 [Candidatus Moranbacteria bacterium]|nr:hypothetical protein [Candidatus Moranbacteria bacterium]